MTRDRFEEIKLAVMAMGAEGSEGVFVEGNPIQEMVDALERFFDSDGRRVVAIESPYKGQVDENTRFARLAMLDSITRGEAPFLGHLLYTQVLSDASPTERELGIRCHLAYVQRSEAVVIYEDFGVSEGMARAAELAQSLGIPVETRRIG